MCVQQLAMRKEIYLLTRWGHKHDKVKMRGIEKVSNWKTVCNFGHH